MTAALSGRLGLKPRELVAIVGAGGKSTILHALGRELSGAGARVVLTTTTMLAEGQATEPVCWSDLPAEVEARLAPGIPLFVAAGRVPSKVTGPSPTAVDRIFTETGADYVIVEADGAKHRSIKAPAEHEPVIPAAATTVIVTVGMDAIGRPVALVAHRPERVAALAEVTVDDILTVEHAAAVVRDPEGGLKGVPAGARAVVVLTKAGGDRRVHATALARLLRSEERIERVALLDGR